MRNLFLAAVSIAAIGVAAPAFAQVGVDVGPGGVRFGVGPRYDRDWRDRDHWRGAYAYDCRTWQERIVTPSGRVIYRTHRDCD
ncbi:MAG TPA: hypothetical protein VKW08_27695 [Xanthobacteraceae bacterium]|jgi:hypothetical protein|nr:hypothetical protein [Xanthobacteraceae bacterium]